MKRSASLKFVATALLLALLSVTPAGAEQPDLTSAIAPLYHSDLHYVGSQSCGGAACHQRPRPGVVDPQLARGGEFGLWSERDPHARALDALTTDTSLHMLGALGIMRDGKIADAKGYENCLRCHSLAPVESQQPPNWNAGESVSCEACHGPAEKWLDQHVQSDWQRQQSAEHGMLATDDLLVRARLCADCHVGSVDREVNHDMIAAGHPALRFEMSADHARLNKHWRDAEENTPQFQWSLWVAGQIASAEAALALTHARLTENSVYRVWPEFAEYNCGDCHHALDVPSARQRLIYQPRSVPRWGDWNYSYLRAIMNHAGTLDDLPQQMVQGFAGKNDELTAAPARARAELNQWIGEQRNHLFSENGLQQSSQTIKPILQQQATGGVGSWEEAAQVYLALLARDAARLRAENRDHPSLQLLERMRETLRFDDDRNFRVFFSAPGEQGPIPYDEFQQQLRKYVLGSSE